MTNMIVSQHQNLKSLVLRNNHIGHDGALELAVALRQNNTLELHDLDSNGIYSDGATALADALVANDAVKDLSLRYNDIGDDGATSIAEMLTRNESIEKVCVGWFGEKGIKAFATGLSRMNGLKSLVVNGYWYTPPSTPPKLEIPLCWLLSKLRHWKHSISTTCTVTLRSCLK
jgi:hypothetical protein